MKYLYYKIFQILKKVKTNDTPTTNAMLLLSLCHFANIFVFHIFLSQASILSIYFESKAEIYLFTFPLGLIVYLINYFLFYKNRDKICEKYKNESKKQKILGNILLACYFFGSFALVFYFGPKYTKVIA